jgi:tripartite-type tricarboxylate transporter receptor subunit TctC
LAEVVPGYEASIWLGLMAPAGLPAPIAARLNAEVNRILALPSTREAQARAGAQPTLMAVAAFGEFLARDIERQREWIKLARIEAN